MHYKKENVQEVEGQLAWGPNRPYKQLEDAKAYFTYHQDGRYEAYIEHPPMHGVTPDMLIWFFKHLDCYTRYNPYSKTFDGPEISVYKLWHLRDHIGITAKKPGALEEDKEYAIAYGSTFEIEEVLIQKHHVKASSIVYDLYYEDEAGNVIGKGTKDNGTNGFESNIGNFGFWLLGPANIKIGYLDHYFQVVDSVNKVMNFQTRFVAGRENFGPVNKVIEHSLSDQLMKDWILHNIEESGESENIIPALFENQEMIVRKSELMKRKVL
ncbi:MAG: hypothetical protein AAFO07_24345 [Bacteroidota bacterium]